MSEFKISSVTQCKTRPKSNFLFLFLAVVVVLEAIAAGCWIFRLNVQITEMERQLNDLQRENEAEVDNVQQ
jgi:uncharacterized membrane protein YciS (DUF1049 family)